MITVDVRLDTSGLGIFEKDIGRMVIINRGDHEGRPEYGNYDVHFFSENGSLFFTADVKDRKCSDGFWPLMADALTQLQLRKEPEKTPHGELWSYAFDRYRNGKPLAEGARVTAYTPEEGMKKAKALFPEESCRDDEFFLRSLQIVGDPSMANDTIEFRKDGEVVGKITNLGAGAC